MPSHFISIAPLLLFPQQLLLSEQYYVHLFHQPSVLYFNKKFDTWFHISYCFDIFESTFIWTSWRIWIHEGLNVRNLLSQVIINFLFLGYILFWIFLAYIFIQPFYPLLIFEGFHSFSLIIVLYHLACPSFRLPSWWYQHFLAFLLFIPAFF